MKRSTMFLVCVVGLVLSLAACGPSGAVDSRGNVEPVGQSTGDTYMLNGNGCPDGFTYVRPGGSYGGCRFEPGDIRLYAYCDPNDTHHTNYYNRGQSGPLWRSDDEPSRRGLQVFWPGGDGVDGQGFACVKERCFDCE